MPKLILSAAVAVAVMAGTALSNSATASTVLYDNLPASSSGTAPANSSWGPLYDSFSTGSSSLSTIALTLMLDATTPSDGGTFTISLLTDSGNSPGTKFATTGSLPDSDLSTTLNPFSVGAALSLAADTLYWVELSSTGSVNWSYSTDTSGLGVANEYFANYGGTGTVRVFPNSGGPPYQMEVVGTATPLPSTWTMLIAGFVGLGFVAYRGTKKGAAALA